MSLDTEPTNGGESTVIRLLRSFTLMEWIIGLTFFGSYIVTLTILTSGLQIDAIHRYSRVLVFGTLTFLMAWFIVRSLIREGFAVFRNVSPWMMTFLALMLLRLVLDTFLYPAPYPANFTHRDIGLFFFLNILLPVLCFSIAIPPQNRNNAFRLYFFLSVVASVLVGLPLVKNYLFDLSNNPYNVKTGINIIIPGRILPVMTCCAIWFWKRDLIKLPLVLFLVAGGTFLSTHIGQRGPLIAFGVTLAWLFLLTDIRKKRHFWLVCLVIVLSAAVSFSFFGRRITRKIDRFSREVSGTVVAMKKVEPGFLSGEEEAWNNSEVGSDLLPGDMVFDEDEFYYEYLFVGKTDAVPTELAAQRNAALSPDDSFDSADERYITEWNHVIDDPTSQVAFDLDFDLDFDPDVPSEFEDDMISEMPSEQPSTRETKKIKTWTLAEYFHESSKAAKEERLKIWFDGLSKFCRSPWIGNPVFSKIVIEKPRPKKSKLKGKRKEVRYFYMHNVVLEAFVTTGIFGGCVFLVVIAQGFRGAYRILRESPELGVFGIIFIFSLTSSLVSFTIYRTTPLWISMAALYANLPRGRPLPSNVETDLEGSQTDEDVSAP